MENISNELPFRDGLHSRLQQKSLQTLIVVPWMCERDTQILPKAYSVHRYTFGAENFIDHHAPVGLKRLSGIGNFSEKTELIMGPDALTRSRMMLPSGKFTAAINHEGVAMLDFAMDHPVFRLIEQSKIHDREAGALVTTASIDPQRSIAQSVEDALLWFEFISDPLARPKVVTLNPTTRRFQPYVPL